MSETMPPLSLQFFASPNDTLTTSILAGLIVTICHQPSSECGRSSSVQHFRESCTLRHGLKRTKSSCMWTILFIILLCPSASCDDVANVTLQDHNWWLPVSSSSSVLKLNATYACSLCCTWPLHSKLPCCSVTPLFLEPIVLHPPQTVCLSFTPRNCG